MAHRLVQALRVHLAQAFALQRVREARVERIDVRGQLALAPEVVPDILIGGEELLRIQLQPAREGLEERRGLHLAHPVVDAFVCEQARVAPDRLAVPAPVAGERPAGQLLAGIPLALAVVEKSERRVTLFQSFQQLRAQQPLARAHRPGIPLRPVAIFPRNLPSPPTHPLPPVPRYTLIYN